MLARVLRNFGVDLPRWTEGEVREIDEPLAKILLGKGLIEEVIDRTPAAVIEMQVSPAVPSVLGLEAVEKKGKKK